MGREVICDSMIPCAYEERSSGRPEIHAARSVAVV